jgi:hypothetical protein
LNRSNGFTSSGATAGSAIYYPRRSALRAENLAAGSSIRADAKTIECVEKPLFLHTYFCLPKSSILRALAGAIFGRVIPYSSI